MTSENKKTLRVAIEDDFFFSSSLLETFQKAVNTESKERPFLRALSGTKALEALQDMSPLNVPINGSVDALDIVLYPKGEIAAVLEQNKADIGIIEWYKRDEDDSLRLPEKDDMVGTVDRLCKVFATPAMQDNGVGAEFADTLAEAQRKLYVEKNLRMQSSMSQKDVSFYAKRAMGLGNE